MSGISAGATPRVRQLSQRRASLLPVIDVGSHKIVCIIAELEPLAAIDQRGGRTHKARVIGIGQQRSQGLKRGAVIDLEHVERAIRHAIDAAERMAKVEVRSAIVTLGGGRLWAQQVDVTEKLGGRAADDGDIEALFARAASQARQPGRILLHVSPGQYSLDDEAGIQDPAGMIGARLSGQFAVVSSDAAAVRNLMLAIERCHIDVDAVVAAPYAAALSVLVEDEAEMGVTVVDFGAGSTGIACFEAGKLVHVDSIAVGGQHITMDIARGLSTRIVDAERLKTLNGALKAIASDERDLLTVPKVDEGDRDVPTAIPKAALVRIIRPRVEEILEVLRDRTARAGFPFTLGRRIIFTGGASQLNDLVDLASRVFGTQPRLGRPLGVKGLPESARGPAYAAAMGLIVFPQVANADRVDLSQSGVAGGTGTDGYFARVTRWLKESF